jgi:hypothetical protein
MGRHTNAVLGVRSAIDGDFTNRKLGATPQCCSESCGAVDWLALILSHAPIFRYC